MPKEEKAKLLNKDLSFGRVRLKDKVSLTKNLSLMLKSGVPLLEALEVLDATTTGAIRRPVNTMLRTVKSGQPLSEGLRRFPKAFSGYFVGAVFAGETSGTLSENLDTLAGELYKEKELTAKIRNSLFYPLLVFFAAIGLGILITVFILPKVVPMFMGLRMKLPLPTRMLIGLANLIKDHGQLILLLSLGLIVLIVWLWRLPKLKPLTHGLLLSAPLFKRLTVNLNLARICRVMGTMLKSGLPIVEALNIAQETAGNWHFKEALKNIKRGVDKGERLSDCLKRHRHLFPEMAIRMIAIGEQSGRLEETFFYLADDYEAEVDAAAKNLATAVEPALLLFIGLTVGFLAIAIITPIYNITGNISR